MNNHYKELIFTNHALQRLSKRGIAQKEAWAAWYNPDKSKYAKSKKAWVYFKKLNDKKIEVVATKNEKNQWVVLSVWSKPLKIERNKAKQKNNYSLVKLLINKLLRKIT